MLEWAQSGWPHHLKDSTWQNVSDLLSKLGEESSNIARLLTQAAEAETSEIKQMK